MQMRKRDIAIMTLPSDFSFRQAGIECFGDSDRESCDVEVVVLTIEAVRPPRPLETEGCRASAAVGPSGGH